MSDRPGWVWVIEAYDKGQRQHYIWDGKSWQLDFTKAYLYKTQRAWWKRIQELRDKHPLFEVTGEGYSPKTQKAMKEIHPWGNQYKV